MDNPFEIINNRLINIENLLLDIKHSRIRRTEPIEFIDFLLKSPLSVRTRNALHSMAATIERDQKKTYTLGQFLKLKPMELLKNRNLGRKGLTEIMDYIKVLGLSFE